MIITSRNNATISNFEAGFRCKSEYPWCIIQVKSKHFLIKNKKKIKEKREFLHKTSFRPNRFFYMVVNQKIITRNDNDLSSNDFKYLRLKSSILLKIVPYEFSNCYETCQNHEHLKTTEILNSIKSVGY
ncbi:Uncharacterized protein FWK35_00000504, partial [Aphis craccivora]